MMRDTFATGPSKQQRPFDEVLRIREAEPVVAVSSHVPVRNASADMLHVVTEAFQKVWRWLERKRTQQLSSRRLRVAETVSLGEKRSVSIIQVDGSQFLIGASAGSVQLIAVLERQDGGRRIMKFEGGS